MVVPHLKARYINVYLPSAEVKELWEEDAKKAGIPLSKFVFEAVEKFRENDDQLQRYDLVKELAEARDEAQRLRSELKMKNLLIEKFETEVYKARHADFGEVDLADGTRGHDEDIIRILKRGKPVEGYSLLKELGIDPRETEAVKLVNNQLESLRRFGLVEETALGWRWIR
ncbi:MAG: hypothetical protein METHAR1v1_1400009 [Methanothrix sp.]|jgi:vacuolar-type H+-ATPase subunit I/STV1|nr:MAG: hypothetical protein METHAR1v1_1400009 [Methanothrix sp.]